MGSGRQYSDRGYILFSYCSFFPSLMHLLFSILPLFFVLGGFFLAFLGWYFVLRNGGGGGRDIKHFLTINKFF